MSTAPSNRIGIEACDCLTGFGDSHISLEALLAEKVALGPTPVLGRAGGDLVPLAYLEDYDETIPPRWVQQVDLFKSKLPAEPWGQSGFPVFVSSSNFDVGSIYTSRALKESRYLQIGCPGFCLRKLKEQMGWGDHVLGVSHACVSAQVAIDMACRHLLNGVAEKALVFSFDFISPFVSGGFHALKILNGQFPAPFIERDTGSIGLGDGLGFVVLSRESTPVQLAANALHNEMYHFTANDPSGSGFTRLANELKTAAGDRRIWVKGHGTGTLDAGRLESNALADTFPGCPLVSWKGALGHTLGSCAVVEMALVMRAMEHGYCPGTVGSSGEKMSPDVALEPFQTSEFNGVALLCNAFGGAHGGCLLTYND